MREKVDQLHQSAKGLSDDHDNKTRRELFSDIGLLELDVESLRDKGKLPGAEAAEYLLKLREAGELAELGFLKNKPKGIVNKLLYFVDEALRIAAVWFWLIDVAVFVVPASMALHMVFPKWNMPGVWRGITGKGCTRLSNVTIKLEGITDETFASTVSVLAFTHASTMDAFILAGYIPCGLYSLAKKELFLIPFFAWILSAYGGIAVNRGDRNQAINALKTSAERAQKNSRSVSGSCVAISPEGTRSKSGQLAEFKRGVFHMWEELQMPLVPMIIMGAYDLYPPGKQMSLPGTVMVRFLPPIHPTEVAASDPAERRAEMSALLRRRYLVSMKDSPPGIGDDSPPQSLGEQLTHKGLVGACLGFNYGMYTLGRQYCERHGWPMTSVAASLTLATAAISIGVYTYNLFLCSPSSVLPWKWTSSGRARVASSSSQDASDSNSITGSTSTPPSGATGGTTGGKQKVL